MTILEQREDKPHLGYSILEWLQHYGRGAPTTEIAHAMKKLSPVSYHNLIAVFLGFMNGEKQRWAKLICRWVTHAAEPLTTEMLAQAVAVHSSPENPAFYQDLQRSLGGVLIRDGHKINSFDDAFYDLPLIGEEAYVTEEHMSYIHGDMAKICLYYILSTGRQYMLKKKYQWRTKVLMWLHLR